MRNNGTSMNAFNVARKTYDDSSVLRHMYYEFRQQHGNIIEANIRTIGVSMTEEEQQTLLGIISEAFPPEDQIYIGAVYENQISSEQGIWVEINKSKAFFGLTIQSALFTARKADWWYPRRDGKLIQDDFEWFELRASLGKNWEESEPKMMKAESRSRVALNIQMETGISEDSLPDPTISQSQTERISAETKYHEDTDCFDDQLHQIEFLSVQGWEGLWSLDDAKTVFRNIRLTGTHEGYRVYMGDEFRDFGADREYQTVARLIYDDEDHLVELQLLGQNSAEPMVILEQTVNGQILIKKIELG